MNEKSLFCVALVIALAFVGGTYYGVFSDDGAQYSDRSKTEITGKVVQESYSDEKEYVLNAVTIILTQSKIAKSTSELSTLDIEMLHCSVWKLAYEDTVENYNMLAGLTVPATFQYKHKTLMAFLRYAHQTYLADYNACMSLDELYKLNYLEEAMIYSARYGETFIKIMPWMVEWEQKYPKEVENIGKSFN